MAWRRVATASAGAAAAVALSQRVAAASSVAPTPEATGAVIRPINATAVVGTALSSNVGRGLAYSPSPLTLASDFDVAVVGAGIVGLATAREVLRRYPHFKVAVLEKGSEVAPHQSSHNSGVIHAGIYYEPGSVMAHTCVRGAALMYDYCTAKKVPHSRCGKLIVATNAAEDAVVTDLFKRATANGVQGLRVLTAAEITAMEPRVAGTSALWSPNTGIADYGAVSRSLAHDVLSTGNADVKLQFQLTHVQKLSDGRVELTGVEPGQNGPTKLVRARNVITCAGLHADRVSVLTGGSEYPKVVAFRGTYYQMKGPLADIVRTNVYPVPSGGGIPVGVHFTPTVNERRGHQMIIGPGACIAFSREGYRMSDVRLSDLLDYVMNGGLWRFAIANPALSLGELWKDFNKNAFLREARKLVPSLKDEDVEASFTGVMAQVFNSDGKAAKDFIFERNVLGGTVLNVRNAPSPAATSSLAIAEHVVDIAEADFGWKKGATTGAPAAALAGSR